MGEGESPKKARRKGVARLYGLLPFAIVVSALALLGLLAVLLPKEAPQPSVATSTSPLPTATATPTVTPRPTRTPTFTPLPTATMTFTPLPPLIHVVKKGEVYGIIAKNYDITVQALLEANGLSESDYIHVGQQLVIPRPTPTGAPLTEPAAPTVTPEAPVSTPTMTFTPLPPLVHVVEEGEVIGVIAKDYGVSVEAILAANSLSEDDYIHIGQELIIPRPTPTEAPQTEPTTPAAEVPTGAPTAEPQTGPAPGEREYTIQKGDTLSDIAKQFDVSVNLLMTRNNISDPTLLHVGDIVIIPAGTPTPLPTPTFRPTNTPIPGPPYLSPALLWPPNDTIYRGTEKAVLLQWAGVGLLAPDEWYVVQVRRPDGSVHEEWTKATAWRVPAELRPDTSGRGRRCYWSVSVMRQSGTEPGKGTVIVPAGETRWLEWY